MTAKSETKRGRGRPRGILREWYGKNLPKMKPVKAKGERDVTVNVPGLGDRIFTIPKGWVPIPLEATQGKSTANVGLTAKNEREKLGLQGRYTIHAIPAAVGRGRGRRELTLYAVEAK